MNRKLVIDSYDDWLTYDRDGLLTSFQAFNNSIFLTEVMNIFRSREKVDLIFQQGIWMDCVITYVDTSSKHNQRVIIIDVAHVKPVPIETMIKGGKMKHTYICRQCQAVPCELTTTSFCDLTMHTTCPYNDICDIEARWVKKMTEEERQSKLDELSILQSRFCKIEKEYEQFSKKISKLEKELEQ